LELRKRNLFNKNKSDSFIRRQSSFAGFFKAADDGRDSGLVIALSSSLGFAANNEGLNKKIYLFIFN
jgi:hypothetical protein